MRRDYRKKIISLLAIIIIPLSLLGKGNYISGKDIRDLEASGHLTSTGKQEWKTKGGLVIRGKDPDGLSRLEHIMRHTRNLEDRKIHGVFTISRAEVIELMDLVWTRARSGSLKGNSRGGNIAYTYTSGKSIGYMGGREGKSKNHPRLTGVRLVVREKSSQVITFFPQ